MDKKFNKQWLLVIIPVGLCVGFVGFCMLLGMIIITSGAISPKDNITTESKMETSISEPTKTVTPVPKTIWKRVIEFDGASTKDTETFRINSNQWRMKWETSPGEYGDMNFQIFIYGANNNMMDIVANVIGKGSDVSYVRQSGEFYLKINTAQKYKIVIEETL